MRTPITRPTVAKTVSPAMQANPPILNGDDNDNPGVFSIMHARTAMALNLTDTILGHMRFIFNEANSDAIKAEEKSYGIIADLHQFQDELNTKLEIINNFVLRLK
jgi:hypothetical protein